MRDVRGFLRRRLAPLALPADREQKILDEWTAQLEELYDSLLAEGRSDDEAWSEIERQCAEWDELSEPLLDREPALGLRDALTRGLFGDLRASLRLLVARPAYSAAIVLTLAVCLGANAAVFTVVHAVLLRPLPVPDPDRIVGLGDVYPTVTPNDILSNDVPSYFDRRQALTALEEQGLFRFWFDTLTIDGLPQELRGVRVTPSVFRVLGVAPALGRTFTDGEGEIGEDRAVVLSHALWQRLYGGDPVVVGKTLRLGWTGEAYTIVGVMPPAFTFFDRGFPGHGGDSRPVQFWLPLAFTPEQKSDAARARYGFFHIGRLRAGATVDQAQAQLDALRASTVARFPALRLAELGMFSSVAPLQEALTRGVRRTLYLLWAGAAFVLLIGVINVANLAIARARERRRELATRLALGARRFQIARQLIVEALAPAALGGGAALVVAAAILEALARSGLTSLPDAADAGLNAPVVGLVVTVSIGVGLLIGWVPWTITGSLAIADVSGESGRSSTGGRTAQLFRRALVVTQVALSVVLLIAAVLLFTSFRHLVTRDAGFKPAGVITATIFPPPSRYPTAEDYVALLDRILERVGRLPIVEAVGLTSNIALSGYESPAPVSATERPAPGDAAVVPSVVAVTPGYFEAMGTPVVRGRAFDGRDRADGQRVAIVDERLAGRLWPGEDPLGQALYRGEAGPFTVVGVVREVRLEGLAGSIESIGAAYFPHTQAPPVGRLRWIAVKSALGSDVVVPALRTALLDIDAELPLADMQTMEERTAHALVAQRLAARLAAMFGLVALFLSALGIYGVLASLVARRTREIGIRMALGSSVGRVFTLVLAEGAVAIGVGLAIGVAGAFAMTGTLEGLLFGVQPNDPMILGGVVLATAGVALLACSVPARRATRVNPVDVLSDQ